MRHKLHIIAHRGYWFKLQEQNSLCAFRRALDRGFGVELDIRDREQSLVISHDLPTRNSKRLESVLGALSKHKNFKKAVFAFNIKSDGIEKGIVQLVRRFGIRKNSFVFDMSVPSMYVFCAYHGRHIHIATRLSDLERVPVLYERAAWVWFDELAREWIHNKDILRQCSKKKKVCIVSPDLHHREYLRKWKHLRMLPERARKNLYLCTDVPYAADAFFNGGTNDD